MFNTGFYNTYYRAPIAAQMAGYSLRQVESLAKRGKIKARREGRKLVVHLGSLYQHRSQNTSCTARRQATCLDGWLCCLPEAVRAQPYRLLAVRASNEFRRPVTISQLYRSFLRLGWLPKRQIALAA